MALPKNAWSISKSIMSCCKGAAGCSKNIKPGIHFYSVDGTGYLYCANCAALDGHTDCPDGKTKVSGGKVHKPPHDAGLFDIPKAIQDRNILRSSGKKVVKGKWLTIRPTIFNYTCNHWLPNGSKGCGKTIPSGSLVVQGYIVTIPSIPHAATGIIWCKECAEAEGMLYSEYVEQQKMSNTTLVKPCLGCGVTICEICLECENPSCSFTGKRVVEPHQLSQYKYLMAKTQKARGYVVLAEEGINVPTPYRIIMDDSDIYNSLGAIAVGSFARPCPTRPRHGFVESRQIKAENSAAMAEELKVIFAEAIAADEKGEAELLIVPFIDAEFNEIITPTRVAVGKGHDGATGGFESRIFPLVGTAFPQITKSLLQKARVNGDEDPYIEVVIDKKQRTPYFTQLRAGVRVPNNIGADFVPHEVRVREVIEASGDLLEWEKQIKQIQEGTIVCHVGGTLISHYGVHCMANDIPIMTSRKPEVGEILQVQSKVEKPNPEAVIRGLVAGAMMPMELGAAATKPMSNAIHNSLTAMMAILHNSAAMSGEDGYWIGWASAIMYRAGMAASHGEARHKISNYRPNRSTVYRMALKDFFEARQTLGHAQYLFKHKSWSSGYGGPAWAKCTDAIIDMDNCIRTLMNKPSNENVAALITSLNTAVNQAHNGGWWLNKFIGQNIFTKASQQDLDIVAKAMATMYDAAQRMDGQDLSDEFMNWRTAPEIEVTNGKIQVAKTFDQAVQIEPLFKTKIVYDWGDPITFSGHTYEPKEGYEGLYCLTCGAEYPELLGNKDQAVQQKLPACGKAKPNGIKCTGILGWVEDKLIQYQTNAIGQGEEAEDAEVDEDPEPESEESSEESSEHAGIDPESAVFKSAEQAKEGLLYKATPPKDKLNQPNFNINAYVTPTEENPIISAQCNVGMKGKIIAAYHVQYRCEGWGGYFSVNVYLKDPIEINIGEYATVPKKLSWSGSHVDNYMTLEVSKHPTEIGWFQLKQETMKIDFLLNPQTKEIKENQKEVKVEQEKQENKELVEAPF